MVFEILDAQVPKVSIGLAVYNGEKYLEKAIQSILAQTYKDFELIVSDNASTDSTAEICRKYAEIDRRIRYSRNSTNIGGANNENLTFKLSRGEYFRWAAHDDVLAPKLLEECVAVLESHPEVVLCCSTTLIIDENGNQTGEVKRKKGTQQDPYIRFVSIANTRDALEETYGLIRSDVLKKTRLQQNYTDSDRTLLSEIALYGLFHHIDTPLFYKRMHQKNVYIDWRTRMAWFDQKYKGKIVLPYWIQWFDYFSTTKRTKLPFTVKARCYGYLIGPWLFSHAKNLIKDMVVAIYMLLHTRHWRINRYASTDNWS